MAHYFRVEVGELETHARGLTDAGDRLKHASSRMADSGEDVGDDDLAGALSDFHDDWNYGLGKTSKAVHVIAEKVAQAARVYRDADEKIASAYRKAGQ